MAVYFGKRHDHVLRDIDHLVDQEPSLTMSSLPKFGETPYLEETTGQTYRMYEMDRDGFTLLAMGFEVEGHTFARALAQFRLNLM